MAIRQARSQPPVVRRPRPIFYPEEDGKLMGETPVHRNEIWRLIETLERRFAGRPDVYVSGGMMMYHVEGNPRLSSSPDVFVAIGAPKDRPRNVYKIWEEVVPNTVIEVSSRKTMREDMGRKRRLYAEIGVAEYFLYDAPTAFYRPYLNPRLQGNRLVGGVYVPIEPAADGALWSSELGLWLVLENGWLRLRDPESGAYLPTLEDLILQEENRAEAEAERAASANTRAEAATRRAEDAASQVANEAARAEAAIARAEAEAARADAEAAARRLAELRIEALEAELRERGLR